ncbi:MAG TPA: hypothetical protein VF105_00060 [Gemmatimonadaceae bacterium]
MIPMSSEATSYFDNDSAMALRAKDACADLRETAYQMNRPEPPEELCEELHIAFERAADRSPASLHELRQTVQRFTNALKDEGASPEATLIAVKSVINSRTYPEVDVPAQDWSADFLRRQVTTWCVKEFFRAEHN